MCELLVGLPDVNVLAVTDVDELLRVTVETRQPRPSCPGCGGPVNAKDRADVEHADLPCFGRRAVLVWRQLVEAPDTVWVEVPSANSRAAEVSLADGTRAVVVESDERQTRDTARTAELVERTETLLLALEERVRSGRLKNAGKIGQAAQRILGRSGVARLFEVEIGEKPVRLPLQRPGTGL